MGEGGILNWDYTFRNGKFLLQNNALHFSYFLLEVYFLFLMRGNFFFSFYSMSPCNLIHFNCQLRQARVVVSNLRGNTFTIRLQGLIRFKPLRGPI
jgi:hypothetical protein